MVIASFSTSTCGPCKIIEPGFAKLSDMYSDYHFYKVVGDKNDATQSLCISQGVKQVPAFYFFRKGERRNVLAGAKLSTMDLIDAIEELRWE